MGTTKRNVPVTIPIQHLPEIDVVLISHGHYDHLHIQSLRHLPGDPLFLIPRGLKALLKKKGFLEERIVELDWWEEWSNQNVTLTFVPAQHWVKRGLFDTNTSRWGGWVLESTAQSLYFAGDSGYFEGFKQLQKIKSIDYALVPIGAYEPEWFMELDHMKPEDAVQAFIDLGASHMVPMHYGTFRLADDTGPEALERFEQAWKEKGINEKKKKRPTHWRYASFIRQLILSCLTLLFFFVSNKPCVRKPHQQKDGYRDSEEWKHSWKLEH